VLPDGDLYDYMCQGCGASLGTKTDKAPIEAGIRSGGRS
jgi:hypothetical protein